MPPDSRRDSDATVDEPGKSLRRQPRPTNRRL